MKKILVTGGAGYIGSKICYDLTDLGYKVLIYPTANKKIVIKLKIRMIRCDNIFNLFVK